MDIETIKRLAAEVWPEGIVVLPSDLTFLEQFTALVLAEDRLPEQYLTFLDGSKVVIKDCPVIMNMRWTAGPMRKPNVNVEACRVAATALADAAVAGGWPEDARKSSAALDRWLQVFHQEFNRMVFA